MLKNEREKAHAHESIRGKKKHFYMHALTYKVTCRFKNALIKQHHRGSVGDGYLQSGPGIFILKAEQREMSGIRTGKQPESRR